MKRQEKKQKIFTRQKQAFGSITRQVLFVAVAMVVFTVMLCWFLNTTFLGRFYTINKEKELSNAYEAIDAASKENELETNAFAIEFERICVNGNISTIVTRPDRTTVVASSNLITADQMLEIIWGSFSGRNSVEIIAETDSYKIGKFTDRRMNAEYLVLTGSLENGDQILMRTALESIKESAAISNQFLIYAGATAIVISATVIFFISRKLTAPLLKLTHIAERMTELDFNAKYVPNTRRKNEIDVLGECMNKLSEGLEKTISELKSANNELQIDIERKNEIDEMRKEFLSNVSHELKTPLALIQGYAEGLQECIHEDAQSREFYCEVIIDEADKMNQMVKKLLTLNQLEFGNDIVQMERFDLTELICGIVNASRILLQQQEIQLTFGQRTEPMYVWADEFKVEEVITNYLSNAIHHCDGEKRIDIKYTRKKDCVRVSVFNTGNQIPAEDLEQVWVKFYKVDKARTREYGGSGIGLSIVKAIMDSFHRECGVINHDNGVEFWMELDTNPIEKTHKNEIHTVQMLEKDR